MLLTIELHYATLHELIIEFLASRFEVLIFHNLIVRLFYRASPIDKCLRSSIECNRITELLAQCVEQEKDAILFGLVYGQMVTSLQTTLNTLRA